MNEKSSSVPIRRILVAIDASASSLAALEAAASLAAKMQAELLGLFIEDINLLRFAGLPFAREISQLTVLARRLESPDMERALRAQAARAQRALALAAESMRVPWSFRTARGQVVESLLVAAAEADLVALGMTRRLAHIDSTVRAVMQAVERPLLLMQQGMCIKPPVLTIYDGSETTARVLAIARELTQVADGEMIVIIQADDAETATHRQQEAASHLVGVGLNVRYLTLIKPDIMALARAIRAQSPGTLVLPSGLPLIQGEMINRLMEQAGCAVLLVR